MKIIVLIFVVFLLMTGVFNFSSAQEILSLEDCVKKALKSNSLIKVENNNISEKAAELKKSKVEKYPYIDATSNYQCTNNTSTIGASIDLSVDTAKFKKTYYASKEFLLKAAEEHKNFVESTIVFKVKSYYFTLMRLKKEYKALQKAKNTLTHHRKITENFVNTGVKLRSALYRVDNQIAALEGDILVKKAEMDNAMDSLSNLTGITDLTKYKIVEYNGILPSLPSFNTIEHDVTIKSPELKILMLRELSLHQNKKGTGMVYLPVLTLGVGYNQDIAPMNSAKLDVHFSASLPLFDFGRTHYDKMKKDALLRKEEAKRKVKENEIRDTVNQLYKKAKLEKNLYLIYQQMYGTVQKSLQQAELEYDSGILSETDLLDMQKRMVDVDVRMNRAFYDYLIAFSQIEYLQGVKK